MRPLVLAPIFLLTLAVAPARSLAAADETPSSENKSVDDWIAALQLEGDENYPGRRQAAYKLGQQGPKARSATAALIVALEDRHMEVRYYAVDALGRIGPDAKEAVPAIVESIGDPQNNKYVRQNAAKALGRIGPDARQAVPVLTAALASDDHVYRVAAAVALWRIEKSEKTVPALIEQLRPGVGKAPFEACRAILEIGPENRKKLAGPMVASLGHTDADVRRAAASALGRIGPDAVELLTDNLDRVNLRDAADALGQIASPVREAVLNHPGASEAEFRTAAAPLETTAAAALVKLLGDDDEPVRTAAAMALAKMGVVAVPALAQALRSEEETIRQAAADALLRVEQYLPTGERVSAGFKSAKRTSVPPLMAAMRYEDESVQRAAVRTFAALSISGDYGKAAMPLLEKFLRYEDTRIRRDAARSLKRLRGS